MRTRLATRTRALKYKGKVEQTKSRVIKRVGRRNKGGNNPGSKPVTTDKQPKTKPSYKESHAVGRRQSSQFVTYTQDGRLFYDLYASSQPTRGTPSTVATSSPDTKRTTYHLPPKESPQNYKRCKGSRKLTPFKDSSLAKNCVVTPSCKSVTVTLQKMQSTKSSTTKAKKADTQNTADRKRSAKKYDKLSKKEKIQRRLKRELGTETIAPSPFSGKRLASLNAVALISAVTLSDRIRRTSKNVSVGRRQSLETIPCQDAFVVESEVSDDANTEPMSVPHQTETTHVPDKQQARFSVVRTVRRKKRPTTPRAPVSHPSTDAHAISPMLSSTVTNPSIARFHSEQFIPLGGTKFGFQQITRQVIHVNDPDKPFNNPTPPHLSVDLSHPIHLQPHPFVPPLLSTAPGHLNMTCPSTSTGPCGQPTFIPYNNAVDQTGAPLSYLPTPNMLHQSIPCYPAGVFLPPIFPLTHVQPPLYPTIFSSGSQNISHFGYAFIPPALNGYPSAAPNLAQLSFVQPFGANDGVNPIGTAYCPQGGLHGAAPHVYPVLWNPHIQCLSQPSGEPSTPLPVLCAPVHTVDGNATTITTSSQSVPEVVLQPTLPPKPNLSPTTAKLQGGMALGSHEILTQTVSGTADDARFPPSGETQSLTRHPHSSPTPQDDSSLHIPPLTKFKDVEQPSVHNKPATIPVSNVAKLPSFPAIGNEEEAWVWEGVPYRKRVFCRSDSIPTWLSCYRAIRHLRDGILIRERDSVLLCSGPDRCSPPYVARITAFYPDPKTGTKMMALLWYYRPEHVPGTSPNQLVPNELYASRHCDTNPVDCIEDKAYVLTASAFCRYMAKTKYRQATHPRPPLSHVVPPPPLPTDPIDGPSNESIEHSSALDDHVPETASPSNVFLCRSVYDYRLKRVCRNLNFHSPVHSQFLSQMGHRPKPVETPIRTTYRLTSEAPTTSQQHPSTSPLLSPPILSPPHETRIRSPSPTSPCSPALRICVPESPESPVNDIAVDESTQPCRQVHIDTEPPKSTTVVAPSPLANQAIEPISPLVNRNCTTTPPPLPMREQQSTPLRNIATAQLPNPTTNNVSVPILTPVQSSIPNSTGIPLPANFLVQKPAMQTLAATMGSAMGYDPCFSGSSVSATSASVLPGLIHWPSVCDSSVLESSADLSVNWAEHGEQIALSLDCRDKHFVQNTTPTADQQTITSRTTVTPSGTDNYLRPDQFPHTTISNVQYILPITPQPTHETEPPRLILL